MEIFKKIARKILTDEITEYENKIKQYESERGSYAELLLQKQTNHESELKKALEEKCKLEKENEILRQYYDLDKEPSDEIKMKIHIDLEINRLKEEKDDLKNEILRLTAICRPPVIVPQPYPYYGFGYRPF